MNCHRLFFGAFLAVNTCSVFAAGPAPILDVSQNPNSLAKQLSSIERKLEARNRAQVEILRQLDDLQSEVNELRGVTELHTHQLGQVLERQRELYQELDRRVNEALKSKQPSAPTMHANGSVTVNTESGYSNNLSENESYDRAVNLVLKDKRYEQAITEFNVFIKKYPNSTYAANAHYWLGQLLFNKGDLAQAEKEFNVVVEQFKNSSKRGDSLLKLAAIAQKQNNKNRAVNLYKQIIAQYPNTSTAKLAQARLASVN
jgi:tol-pal system protein YbgF